MSSIRAHKEGRPDWWWVGRDSPMIFREMRTDHWGLTVPYFPTLIAAKNSPFFGDFRRAGIEVGNGSGNEASIAAFMAHKEGRPDWWRAGRDFPWISRILRTDRWGLTMPYFRALISAKNASFCVDFTRPGIGWKWLRNAESLSALTPQGRPDWRRVDRDFPRISR